VRRRAVPLGADTDRPPAELLTFDVRQWIDPDEPVPPAAWEMFGHAVDPVTAWRVSRGRERHEAACAAWTADTGLPVHRPAPGESWDGYRARVGPAAGRWRGGHAGAAGDLIARGGALHANRGQPADAGHPLLGHPVGHDRRGHPGVVGGLQNPQGGVEDALRPRLGPLEREACLCTGD
jgi:hypothetical protein